MTTVNDLETAPSSADNPVQRSGPRVTLAAWASIGVLLTVTVVFILIVDGVFQ